MGSWDPFPTWPHLSVWEATPHRVNICVCLRSLSRPRTPPGLLHLPPTPADHSPPCLRFHLELSNAKNCVLGAQAPSGVSYPLSSDRPLDILQGLPTPNNPLKQLHRVTIDGAHRVGAVSGSALSHRATRSSSSNTSLSWWLQLCSQSWNSADGVCP